MGRINRFRLRLKKDQEKILFSLCGMSTVCPFCGARGRRITRGLFYCPKCNKVINADVIGCLNIAKKYKTIIPNPSRKSTNPPQGTLTL